MHTRGAATIAIGLVGWFVAAGCGRSTAPPRPAVATPASTSPAPASPAVASTTAGAPPAAPASVVAAPACDGPGQRRWGSTCCTSEGAGREDRIPGMVYLSCTGPQVGQACGRKGDCDVACSCDPPGERRRPGAERTGPADGARGVTGVCADALQIGVWMCQLDEQGQVTHVIVD